LKRLKHELDILKFTKVIEIAPEDYRAYVNRGFSYYYNGQYDLAIKDFTKAIELKPDFFTPYNNRGNCYIQIEKYDLAIKDFTKAIELNPKNGIPYNNRGFAFIMLGRLDDAERDIRESLRINPDNIYALNSMAELYSARNDAIEACKWLKKAIEKGYNNWKYIRTSKTYDNIRNSPCFKDIIRDIRQRIKDDPQSSI
jgi:tetratricopeptide (TPR) repeat protein